MSVDAIGQQIDGPYITAPPARERGETPKQRAQRAHHAAVSALHEAEAELESERWRHAEVAADVVMGTASDDDYAEVAAALDAAERAVRRWRAAVRELEHRAGIVRDTVGNVISH